MAGVNSNSYKDITIVDPEKNNMEQVIERNITALFPKRKIAKVLLIGPPDGGEELFNYSTAKRGRYWNFPLYGLGVIASALREQNIEVRIINLNNEILKACRNSASQEHFDFSTVWKDALGKEVKTFSPDFIGVTCMFTQSHKSTVLLCNRIREIFPHIPLALGGVHITNCFIDRANFSDLLQDFSQVDLFFLFEAEIALNYFVKAINKKAQLTGIYQLYMNSSKEKLYFPAVNPPEQDALSIIPAYDLMKVGEVSRFGVIGSFAVLKDGNPHCATIMSNRGCRGRCTYCSVRRFHGSGVRHKSVETIISELIRLRDEQGIDHVMWLDDDLFFNHKRAINLFNEMVKRKVGITWDCTNGVIASSCQEELLASAAESGCIGVNIGVESGNPRILKTIKKPGTIETFLSAAENIRKFKEINSRIFLMIGFPDETYRMMLDTYHLAVKMDMDWNNITILQPLPNTPIYDSMVQQGLIEKTGADDIRYNSGPYGKKREQMRKNIFSDDFYNPFEDVDLDTVPQKSQLEYIWLYMNFHLNFKRIFKVQHPAKQGQLLKYLQYITDVIAPDDPFPMYFCGYLQSKVNGKIDNGLISRLEESIETSEYWRHCFNFFKLSPGHLKAEV